MHHALHSLRSFRVVSPRSILVMLGQQAKSLPYEMRAFIEPMRSCGFATQTRANMLAVARTVSEGNSILFRS